MVLHRSKKFVSWIAGVAACTGYATFAQDESAADRPAWEARTSAPRRLPARDAKPLPPSAAATTTVNRAGIARVSAQAETRDEAANKVQRLLDSVTAAEVRVDVTLRHSKLIRMKAPITRVSVADPTILEVVAFGTREVEIIGKETGSTTVTFWVGGDLDPEILSMRVRVTKDRTVDDLRRLEYSELQTMINELFPNSKVQLVPFADKLIIRGEAADEQEAVQILQLVRERGSADEFNGYGGYDNLALSEGVAANPAPDGVQLPESSIVSLLTVPGVKQVMLKVRIAELSRSAVRQLGADVNFNAGDVFFSSILSGGGNILTSGTFSDGSFNLVLNALESNGMAKILAEPNLVTLSGETANFIAGGEFAVPTVVGVGGAQAATTSFKGFGTQLQFTPVVLDHDRIRLTVSPTFSSLNSANSVNGIFGTNTRSVSTKVELREGQVLAIAGLLQEQSRGDLNRIPWLGDIPLVNVLFADRTVTRDETELIILVSPELVHPMEPEDAPLLLPGMEVTEPDNCELYWHGQIEGDPNCHFRSTVYPWRKHRAKYHADEFYLNGVHGLSQ